MANGVQRMDSRAAELSQREYENQEAWLMSLAAEQRDLKTLRRLIVEYPGEARKILGTLRHSDRLCT